VTEAWLELTDAPLFIDTPASERPDLETELEAR
jgi:hypothetical protein